MDFMQDYRQLPAVFADFPEAETPTQVFQAMDSLAPIFPQGTLELDHAVACELPRESVQQIFGPGRSFLQELKDKTLTEVETTDQGDFVKIMITGRLVRTYAAHFLIMKRYHDINAPPAEPNVDALQAKVRELQAQLAIVKNAQSGRG